MKGAGAGRADRRPMSVVVTTNRLDPGGAERQRVLLCNGLAQLGHEVTLAALQSAEGALVADLHESVRVLDLGAITAGRVLTARSPLADVLLTGVTNTEYAYGLTNRYASRTARRWVAASHHAYPRRAADPYVPYNRGLRALSALPDVLIALDEAHKRHLRAHTSARRVAVIANGVDEVAGSQGRRQAGNLGFLGRITRQKGLDMLLRAWAASPKWSGEVCLSLSVYGAGPEAEECRQIVGLRPDVAFHGWAPPGGSVLRHFGALLVPSRWEAQPMVIMEAMAAGAPIVASDVGGVSSLLAEGHGGMLVRPNVPAWRAALTQLTRAATWRTLQAGALAASGIVSRFSSGRMVEKHIELFQYILGRK